MDSRNDAAPLLPLMRRDLIDYTLFQFARVFEADAEMERGLGVDVNYAEIDSSFPGPGRKPDVRLIGHVLVSGCHPNCRRSVARRWRSLNLDVLQGLSRTPARW